MFDLEGILYELIEDYNGLLKGTIVEGVFIATQMPPIFTIVVNHEITGEFEVASSLVKERRDLIEEIKPERKHDENDDLTSRETEELIETSDNVTRLFSHKKNVA